MMRNNTEVVHNQYLDHLINNLSVIDEDMKEVRWVLKDGLYLHEHSHTRRKLCDIILVYDGHGVPIELKGSWKKRPKAKEQIASGVHLLNHELGLTAPYGKIVIYTPKGYEYERVPTINAEL